MCLILKFVGEKIVQTIYIFFFIFREDLKVNEEIQYKKHYYARLACHKEPTYTGEINTLFRVTLYIQSQVYIHFVKIITPPQKKFFLVPLGKMLRTARTNPFQFFFHSFYSFVFPEFFWSYSSTTRLFFKINFVPWPALVPIFTVLSIFDPFNTSPFFGPILHSSYSQVC